MAHAHLEGYQTLPRLRSPFPHRPVHPRVPRVLPPAVSGTVTEAWLSAGITIFATSAIGISRRNTPRTITRKCVSGFTSATGCSQSGMFCTGLVKPDSIIKGGAIAAADQHFDLGNLAVHDLQAQADDAGDILSGLSAFFADGSEEGDFAR